MAELGGMLAVAILKMVGVQIGSAIRDQIKLQEDFSEDLKKMKMALGSIETVLRVAERRSITDELTLLWLKRLKNTMYDISDMIDEFEADTQEITQPSPRKFSLKKHMSAIIPVGPKYMLANRMKTTREDLEEITSQRNNYNLLESTNTNELRVINVRETSSVMDDQIVGRTEERDTILASLSDEVTEDMTILPIYGIGGLGKTTLAKMVFNSFQFKDYSQVWIYVSQIYDLKKICNSIISQLTKKESLYTEMQMIHTSLLELLADKKILIVLDDLWESEGFHLDSLKTMLKVGIGSKVVVVVTTRDEDIAKKISSIPPFKLAPMTNDMCWTVIKQKSNFKTRDDKQLLEQIGKDIASKCGGVVLAAQSLGHMLRFLPADEWETVRDSNFRCLSNLEDTPWSHVLASLRLSYSVMPSYLKICFAYCAIFPKGYNIAKDDLIHQWISLGFIEPTHLCSSWQLGEKYIRQLSGLSFLQDSKLPSTNRVNLQEATSFTMHDLVHDFARYILDDEILFASKHGSTGRSYCQYALLNDCSKPLGPSKIRALRFQDCGKIRFHHDSISSAKSLRVLDLGECYIHKLPDSIGVLKQLRYLNAPRIQHEVIPNSITRLSKLIYLNLSGSSAIKVLPEPIVENGALMYLVLSGCSGIKELPKSLGGLKKLVHLLLGRLEELQYLNLSYCKNIGELPGALAGLTELQYLNLAFSSYLECCRESEVLGALTNLEYLNLSSGSCELKKLPEALGSFSKLKHLNLSGCRDLQELPSLFGDLKILVHLDLSNCPEVNVIPKAFDGLTNLQHLNLSVAPEDYTFHLGSLTGLSEVICSFTNLRYLNLSTRIDYIYRDTFYMPIEDHTIDSFLYYISTLANLEHLDLSYNRCIFSIPGSIGNLRKLHTLDLSHRVFLRDIL